MHKSLRNLLKLFTAMVLGCGFGQPVATAQDHVGEAPTGAELQPDFKPTSPPAPPQDVAPDGSNDNGQEAPSSEMNQSGTASPNFGPDTARATMDASHRYADIASKGGWPRLASALGPDSQGKDLVQLRRRLAAEGYLSADAATKAIWDDRLTEALKSYQSNLGLNQTGVLSKDTLRELNVPARVRARQLAATAKRLTDLHFQFDQRYVDVNIAAATVETVEDNHAVKHYTAIVGGQRDPSPEIISKIISVDINPAWTLPISIIRKEVLPKLRKDPAYLSRERIRVFDGQGHEIDLRTLRRLPKSRAAQFTFRQDPGAKNSLGAIRIWMPNKKEVYMHDTPKQNLFERSYRFLSHGCVHVDGVYDLAAWLLQSTPGAPSGRWDEAALHQKVEDGRSERIRLSRPVSVVWTYMTGWASEDGAVHFRSDIYGLDKRYGR